MNRPISNQELPWRAIISTINGAYELGFEGNSGEFSDKKKAKKLRKEFKIHYDELVARFRTLTNLTPEWVWDNPQYFEENFVQHLGDWGILPGENLGHWEFV